MLNFLIGNQRAWVAFSVCCLSFCIRGAYMFDGQAPLYMASDSYILFQSYNEHVGGFRDKFVHRTD